MGLRSSSSTSDQKEKEKKQQQQQMTKYRSSSIPAVLTHDRQRIDSVNHSIYSVDEALMVGDCSQLSLQDDMYKPKLVELSPWKKATVSQLHRSEFDLNNEDDFPSLESQLTLQSTSLKSPTLPNSLISPHSLKSPTLFNSQSLKSSPSKSPILPMSLFSLHQSPATSQSLMSSLHSPTLLKSPISLHSPTTQLSIPLQCSPTHSPTSSQSPIVPQSPNMLQSHLDHYTVAGRATLTNDDFLTCSSNYSFSANSSDSDEEDGEIGENVAKLMNKELSSPPPLFNDLFTISKDPLLNSLEALNTELCSTIDELEGKQAVGNEDELYRRALRLAYTEVPPKIGSTSASNTDNNELPKKDKQRSKSIHPRKRVASHCAGVGMTSEISPNVGIFSASNHTPKKNRHRNKSVNQRMRVASETLDDGFFNRFSTHGDGDDAPCHNYKTELCWDWAQTKQCPRGRDCTFAHGESQLRHRTGVNNGNGLFSKRHMEQKPRHHTFSCQPYQSLATHVPKVAVVPRTSADDGQRTTRSNSVYYYYKHSMFDAVGTRFKASEWPDLEDF